MQDSDEEIIAEEDAEMGPAALKRLRERLAIAVKEKQEYLEGWQRTRADFANYKREEAQMEKEKEERIKTQIIEELVPLLDSLDISLQNANPELQKSLGPVYKQFLTVLKRLGVEQIGMGVKEFNPNEHEAIQEVEGEAALEHSIIRVFRPGYKIGERVIRPAQVAIGVIKK